MPGLDPSIVKHFLPLDTERFPPKRQHLRRQRAGLLLRIKEEIIKQINAGFLEVCNYSEWVANIVPVEKKDGRVRVCVDYRDLNKASPKDNFPLPHIDVLRLRQYTLYHTIRLLSKADPLKYLLDSPSSMKNISKWRYALATLASMVSITKENLIEPLEIEIAKGPAHCDPIEATDEQPWTSCPSLPLFGLRVQDLVSIFIAFRTSHLGLRVHIYCFSDSASRTSCPSLLLFGLRVQDFVSIFTVFRTPRPGLRVRLLLHFGLRVHIYCFSDFASRTSCPSLLLFGLRVQDFVSIFTVFRTPRPGLRVRLLLHFGLHQAIARIKRGASHSLWLHPLFEHATKEGQVVSTQFRSIGSRGGKIVIFLFIAFFKKNIITVPGSPGSSNRLPGIWPAAQNRKSRIPRFPPQIG
ncbi:hypothetical protein CRG98_035840 [Punica granatum]|uniref:Reverse transcriptase domain-containing protein n=1 Tax=Punica granatum TaxID=22663 RepID=A0A2I0IID3_PUNGR|nr:hypothetical protein CRG98_035840 [Punica granatum]